MTDSPKPLKVLHIGKYFPPYAGGMETYLRDLMAAQARQGLEPEALVHQSELSRTSRAELYETGEHKLPVTRAAVWARLLFTPLSPTFPWLLNTIIKQQKPDLLHFHMPNVSAFWALFLPGARSIPWVIHWHSDVLASGHSLGLRLFYSLYRPFERALLRHSARVIVTSPPYLKNSKPLLEFQGKCEVVPLGLDPANLTRPNALIKQSDEAVLRVLAVGRLTYYKGFEFLVQAASLCDNTEIHLVGTGDQENKLKALAKELCITNRVVFHGHLTDQELASQFAVCDCLCLPSIERTEAFGMVLLEAMSHGKATVVSNVPGSGMGWVVTDGVTGYHAPPEDGRSLAESLRQLRDNRDNMHQLGNNGLARFNQLFHIERSASGVRRVYSKAIGNVDTG
ncbi:MAG: glycosyltransferase [Halioglobus sp.]